MSEKKLDDILGSNFQKEEERTGKLIYKKLRGNLFKKVYCVCTMASHAIKYSKTDIVNVYILN